MRRIDAHQHFWQFDPARDHWITPDMRVLRRDFGPAELAPVLPRHGFAGCVAVQAAQTKAETDYLLDLAAAHEFILGVVGWVDLRAADVEARLDEYQECAKLKGFRHILQSEPQRDLMLTPAFRRGVAALAPRGFTYDLLVLPDQLGFAAQLAGQFPNQRFVLNHIGKPAIRAGRLTDWTSALRDLAARENVWCKVSGLVTEADWHAWQPADFRACLDAVFEAFGSERVLFGSDWPVCLLAADYGQVVKLVEEYVAPLAPAERASFWGRNAAAFYGL